MSYSYGIQSLPTSSNPHILGFSSTKTNDTVILELWAGATNATRVWRFTAAGDVLPESALGTTATRGFLYIPGGNGPPTGNPANDASGIVPLYYDYANDALYAYNGSWVSVSLT